MSNEAEEIEAVVTEIAQEATKGPFVTGWPGPCAIDELYAAARLILAARQERDALQAKLDRIESTQRTYYDVEARAAQAEKELDEANNILRDLLRALQGDKT